MLTSPKNKVFLEWPAWFELLFTAAIIHFQLVDLTLSLISDHHLIIGYELALT